MKIYEQIMFLKFSLHNEIPNKRKQCLKKKSFEYSTTKSESIQADEAADLSPDEI